jgi:hypothetical protein
MRDACIVLFKNHKWERQECRWEDHIKVDLKEVEVDWIEQTQNRIQWENTVMNLQVPESRGFPDQLGKSTFQG